MDDPHIAGGFPVARFMIWTSVAASVRRRSSSIASTNALTLSFVGCVLFAFAIRRSRWNHIRCLPPRRAAGGFVMRSVSRAGILTALVVVTGLLASVFAQGAGQTAAPAGAAQNAAAYRAAMEQADLAIQ